MTTIVRLVAVAAAGMQAVAVPVAARDGGKALPGDPVVISADPENPTEITLHDSQTLRVHEEAAPVEEHVEPEKDAPPESDFDPGYAERLRETDEQARLETLRAQQEADAERDEYLGESEKDPEPLNNGGFAAQAPD